MKVNFLKIDHSFIHFEIIADNGAIYYFRDYTDSVNDEPLPLGIAEQDAPMAVSEAARIAFKKVKRIMRAAQSGTASDSDNVFKPLRYNRYTNIDVVVNAVNEISF